MKLFTRLLILTLLTVSAENLIADEGMWTYDNPPAKQLKEKYNFEPTQQWLDNVRLSTLRLPGGTGSFVSPNGLIMTNYHVVTSQVARLSDSLHNYAQDGFYAEDMEDEIPIKRMVVYNLRKMDNVTAKVHDATKNISDPSKAAKAREEILEKLNDEAKQDGFTSQIVKLYKGAEYWIYTYKLYNDIRLVFSPEHQAAFYGGDWDNFVYPSYDLDVAFLRAYENGKPVNPSNFFNWNTNGPSKDELVFASGNPGRTDRIFTYDQIVYERDFALPYRVKLFTDHVKNLKIYAAKGEEEKSKVFTQIFYMENALKSYSGKLDGLNDPDLIKKKLLEEDELKTKIYSDPKLRMEYGAIFNKISRLVQQKSSKILFQNYRKIQSSIYSAGSRLYTYLVEKDKNESERLDRFSDSRLEKIKKFLETKEIEKDLLERMFFASSLFASVEALGKDDEFVEAALNEMKPKVAAEYLFNNTKLHDPEFRKNLLEGGLDAFNKSDDPLVKLIAKIEPRMHEDAIWLKKNVSIPLVEAQEKLALARFAAYGKNISPDATFTPRLSYGTVKGYPMNGTIAPYKTTLYGVFDRAESFDNEDVFKLAAKFVENMDDIDLSTPANFATTCDMVGGSSGSAIFNKNLEVLGILFDGNIETLPNHYIYDESKQRGLAVHASYIIEALRNVYDADDLADELERED